MLWPNIVIMPSGSQLLLSIPSYPSRRVWSHSALHCASLFAAFLPLSFTPSSLTPPAVPSFSPSKVWPSIMLGLLFSTRSLPCVLMLSLLGLWQMQQKVVKEVSSVVHLDTVEAGPDYCVKAQTYVEAINRSSSFSQTQCVRAQGNSQPSFLFPWCSHAQEGYPSSSSFRFHPVSPVLFANVLPICSLGEVETEDSGVQPPTLALVSFPGVFRQRISRGWVGRAATRGCRLTALSGLSSQSL